MKTSAEEITSIERFDIVDSVDKIRLTVLFYKREDKICAVEIPEFDKISHKKASEVWPRRMVIQRSKNFDYFMPVRFDSEHAVASYYVVQDAPLILLFDEMEMLVGVILVQMSLYAFKKRERTKKTKAEPLGWDESRLGEPLPEFEENDSRIIATLRAMSAETRRKIQLVAQAEKKAKEQKTSCSSVTRT